jgi:putative ABC transport system ATP-binding protein
MSASAALETRQLAKRLGGRAVLSGCDLAVAAGEVVAILGESGSGKSTLLNLVAGLDTPDSGEVWLAGQRFDDHSDDVRTLLRRRAVGFVFQAFHVLPHLTVGQNVALPLALLGTPSPARVAELLAAVGLADRADSWPRELSGGELQRVAIARALVHRPAVLLADEPTGNLDPDTAAQVLDLLVREIRAQQAAGVLVTHSALAARSTDRVLRLTGGRLVPDAVA